MRNERKEGGKRNLRGIKWNVDGKKFYVVAPRLPPVIHRGESIAGAEIFFIMEMKRSRWTGSACRAESAANNAAIWYIASIASPAALSASRTWRSM